MFLQSGGTFNLANGITTAATLAAVGTAAVDTFDASAVTGYGLVGFSDSGRGSRNVVVSIRQSIGFATARYNLVDLQGRIPIISGSVKNIDHNIP